MKTGMLALAAPALSVMAALLSACAESGGEGRGIQAESLYNGTGRSLWAQIPDVPDPAVAIIEPAPGGVVAIAGCGTGRVDLASLVPQLWSDPPTGVRYAQLTSGGRPIGAPLVLQPMISPRTAALVEPGTGRAFWIDDAARSPAFDARAGVVRFYSESPVVCAGFRVYTEKRLVVETSLGEMEFAMHPDAAPNTTFNFVHLAENGYYTDTIVHRVVSAGRDGHPFVIQFGDPTGTGDGSPGYAIDLEPTTLGHDLGVISMARDSEPNTNGSQVFVCLSREGTARLDGKYCAFGTMVRGHDVLRAIAAVPVAEGTDRPRDPPIVRRVRVIDAPARPVPANRLRTRTQRRSPGTGRGPDRRSRPRPRSRPSP